MAILTQLTPEGHALLETISGPESAGKYNVMYGGGLFDDYSDHPRTPVLITSGPNKGKYSTAAGKYQFLGSTWDDVSQTTGVNDFSPQSQDLNAWVLAQQEYKRDTGRDLQGDLAAGDVSRVPGSLKNQWTSMPGGIEQGITGNKFNNAYWQNMGLNLDSVPDLGALDMSTAGTGPLGSKRPVGAVQQGAQAGNTDYMNSIANKFAASKMDSTGMMPGWSEIANMGRKPILPVIGPTGGPGVAAPPAPKKATGLFDGLLGGIGNAFNTAGANIKGIGDTLGDAGVAAGGAIRNKINPLQAMAGIFAQKLPDNNLGQGLRAAMGFQNPNVGMTLGKAPNGGTVVQGVNGKMNSISQSSDWWKQATGQSSGGSRSNNDSLSSI